MKTLNADYINSHRLGLIPIISLIRDRLSASVFETTGNFEPVRADRSRLDLGQVSTDPSSCICSTEGVLRLTSGTLLLCGRPAQSMPQ